MHRICTKIANTDFAHFKQIIYRFYKLHTNNRNHTQTDIHVSAVVYFPNYHNFILGTFLFLGVVSLSIEQNKPSL